MGNDKKITLELFLMGCMSDRFHSVRVIDQYKEILENEPKMCSFFATKFAKDGGVYSQVYF